MSLYKNAMYMEKQIIMVVQAVPNAQPGGVQGALFILRYHSVCGPLSISHVPIANAPKFITKKNKMYLCSFMFHIIQNFGNFLRLSIFFIASSSINRGEVVPFLH